MLNQHPGMAVMYEAEPFGLFRLDPDSIFPEDWPVRLEFFNQAISRHRLDSAALPKKKPGADCLRAMFRAWAARKNAVVMGGKSPVYHAWLPGIARVFPEADFIIIWRNPLDCCRSAVQAGQQNRFFNQAGILTRMFFGSAEMAKGLLRLRAAGRRVHELAFNDLLADPEAELQNICDFVGLTFNPQMLDLQLADYSMVPPGEHHGPARSGAVQRDRTRTEILAPAFLAKGRRYFALWRRNYPDSVFARTLPDDASVVPPGWFEQFFDRLIYWHWRARDHFKRRVLRQIPLGLWVRLRGRPQFVRQADQDVGP